MPIGTSTSQDIVDIKYSTVLSLFKNSPLISPIRIIPLLIGEKCIGAVRYDNVPLLRTSRHFSYTKVNKVRVLKLNGTDGLESFKKDLIKKGALAPSTVNDQILIFADPGCLPFGSIDRKFREIIGAKISRTLLLIFDGRGANCSVWMGRRHASVEREPCKLQTILSFEGSSLGTPKEQFSEIAYRTIGMQPDQYKRLACVGLFTNVGISKNGINRVCNQVFELDLSEYGGTFKPLGHTAFDSVEAINIFTLLELCKNGAVYESDIPLLVSFAIRHGIITPEIEENYSFINQILSYDIVKPF